MNLLKSDLFNTLDALTEKGFLRKVISPCGKLVLYNYTDKCTYERAWIPETIGSRGTVYEIETGNRVALAFPKFFNFSELPEQDQRQILKDSQPFEVYEKVDGSLGIVYYYDNKWHVNTRGSFTSDQAIEAEKMLSLYDLDKLDRSVTYLVEIIYPENRIILDYGSERKLVLLAAYKTLEKKELNYQDLRQISKESGLDLVERHNINTLEEIISLQDLMTSAEEGFVVKFEGGYRLKFKSLEYLEVARILAHLSPLHLWDTMSNGKVKKDVLINVPEEFRSELDVMVEQLENQYEALKQEIYEEKESVVKEIGSVPDLRKQIGLRSKSLKHMACIFAILDNREDKLDKYILRKIRPKDNQIKNTE